jgi:hypothetical protein
VVPVTQVRSTLVASSLQAVRDRQLFERYCTLLPRERHDVIVHSVAGSWLAVDDATAHYRAMDSLGLMPNEVFEIGRSVAEKVQGSVLSTLAKLATGTGVTPWQPLAQLHRLWARIFIGGAVSVCKRGPKEAHCEVLGNPLSDIPYFRGAFRGLINGGLSLFCTKAYVTELTKLSEPQRIVFRLAWA